MTASGGTTRSACFSNREVSRLARAGIRVFLIRGNHDAESVVTSSVALPESVVRFSTRKFETHAIEELRVAVHGRSFPDRAVTENWAIEYPEAKAGWFNIGMLHTSCDGRPPHAPYAPCSIADLRTRGYDYWALGHVHEHEILARDPWIVYPGNLQGRSVRECGARGAVIVDVEDGRVAREPRRVLVDRARFADVSIDISTAERDDDVWQAVKRGLGSVVTDAADRLVAARVRLTGATTLHRDLISRRQQITTDARASLQHLHDDLWLEKLLIETSDPRARAAPNTDLASIDLAAMIDAEAGDDVRVQVDECLAGLRNRLPGYLGDELSADKFEALIAEARTLVLGRAGERTR